MQKNQPYKVAKISFKCPKRLNELPAPQTAPARDGRQTGLMTLGYGLKAQADTPWRKAIKCAACLNRAVEDISCARTNKLIWFAA